MRVPRLDLVEVHTDGVADSLYCHGCGTEWPVASGFVIAIYEASLAHLESCSANISTEPPRSAEFDDFVAELGYSIGEFEGDQREPDDE